MAGQLKKIYKLVPQSTLFLFCDVQEKFRPAMKYFDPMVKNANKLVQAGKILEIPLLATEQYPEKLGNLVKEIDISHSCGVFPKTKFSMAIDPILGKIEEIYGNNLEDIILFGIETHICVEQTAMDFVEKGYNVHVVADCCMSRLLQDRDLALARLKQIGCLITTSESVIFNLMRDKEHPKFNDIRKLVIEPSADVGISAKL